LDNDPLVLAAGVVYEVNHAVNALVTASLANLAAFLAA
jgi:hypothetical protein